ncbi:ankyrin repeat-containing domain protein [Podospora didyma]|uniref:Ankyrin repeat-containing domain protein n=1 Tax=Podospora didyma TaxID=330526 RepID=A0AAE0N8H3_9PEZI|nr:ankyrin repeat-containing domain protein [Podospora didyma]
MAEDEQASEDNPTELHIAARKIDIAQIRSTLDAQPAQDFEINAKTAENNHTPLLDLVIATLESEELHPDALDCLRLLASHGADVNAQDSDDLTALHRCALWHDHDIAVALLVEHGAKANIVDADAGSPLHSAVYGGSEDIIKFLLSQPGIKECLSIANKQGYLPLHLARVDIDVLSTIAYLLDHGADPNKSAGLGQNPVLLAALSENLDAVQLLASRGADLKAMSESSDSGSAGPLQAAVVAGHPDLCRWLVTEAGCQVDQRDSENYTPLIHAAGYSRGDSAETVRTLVELGADMEAQISDGRRPLHFAAFKGQPNCAAELVRLGADVDAEDINGWTALHFVGKYHHPEVAKVLLDKGGAKVGKKVRGGPRPKKKDGEEFDIRGFTAADLAKIVRGGKETVGVLLERGGTLSDRTKDLVDEDLWEEEGNQCCVM